MDQPDINFDLYKVFCMVAEQGNLSAAARKLFVSQSAVSQAIKQLETRLGGRLFNRTSRGVTLTAEGEMLFGYADSACKLLKNAEAKFFEMKNAQAGTVRIGASDTVCSLFLLDKLGSYHQAYPNINMQVFNRTTGQLIELLKSGAVDMIFINLPIEPDPALEVREMMPVSDCFVVGGRYSFLARRTFSLKELEQYPVLMLETTSHTRNMLDAFLHSRGVHVTPAVELGSMELLLDFAKIGLGIAAVARQAADSRVRAGQLYPLRLSEPLPRRAIGLVTMHSVSLPFAATRFIRHIDGLDQPD